jgi:hypothetical protein
MSFSHATALTWRDDSNRTFPWTWAEVIGSTTQDTWIYNDYHLRPGNTTPHRSAKRTEKKFRVREKWTQIGRNHRWNKWMQWMEAQDRTATNGWPPFRARIMKRDLIWLGRGWSILVQSMFDLTEYVKNYLNIALNTREYWSCGISS